MLFVDLVGYSSLTEGWDAEDVRELLSGYFDVARTVVERYGGRLEKFIGDAVVAVWGSQSARADDAERSVRAGLDVVEAVSEYGRERGLGGLAARAGAVTGQVASWGSDIGLVAGERVNLAARVQSAAEPGAVLVDEATMLATRATVAYAQAGLHSLKGFSVPVPLWRATRVVAGLGGAQRADGLEAAFLGRSRELALVKELFHASVEGSRARLVAISGVAGIGKSRLGWEFEKYVDGLAAPVFWHRGRCPSYGEGVAFSALAEMVRAQVGVSDGDTTELTAAKVSEAVARWVPDGEERHFVEPRLAVLVGAADREFSAEDLFAGWRLFLERLATVQPVVMVFEDLHWADNGLLDFIEYLLDWSAGLPIYLLGFARPELAERRSGWLGDRRNATLLHLDPLPEAVIEELLSDLVPNFPKHVRERIAGQAGGIPLYAVETVRSLVDRGLVVSRDGAFTLVGDVESVDVPASLTLVIAARLDGLPAAEKDLVKRLSVLGDAFARRLVAAVSDLPPEHLDPLLQSLVRKEILSVRVDSMSPERSEYAFMQAMLRSVAYDSVSRRERKIRHQAVAAHLRSTLADDGAEAIETIAAHLQDAYAAAGAGPEAEDLRAEAGRAYERAGTRAGTLGAPDTAERHFRTAAQLSENEADRARVIAAAAQMAETAGRLEDALELFTTATDAHLQAGRTVEAAGLAESIGWVYLNLRRPELALRTMQEALTVLEPEHAEAAVGLYPPLGGALAETGDKLAAADHLERGLVLSTALPDFDALMAGLHTKAYLLASTHRHVEAEALLRAVVKVAHEQDDVEFEARARGSLGWLLAQGDRPDATTELETSLALARRLGNAPFQAESTCELALVHFYAGRWEDAERYATQASELLPDLWAIGRLPLLLLLVGRGELAAADQLRRSIAEVAKADDPEDRAAAGIAQGVLALTGGRFDAALAAAGEVASAALATEGLWSREFRLAWPLAMDAGLRAQRLDEAEALLALVGDAPAGHLPPYLKAQLARYRALLGAARDEHADVEADLMRAVESFRDLGYAYWLARAQADLGRRLAGQGRVRDAEPLLAEALTTFSRLGARPDADALGAPGSGSNGQTWASESGVSDSAGVGSVPS